MPILDEKLVFIDLETGGADPWRLIIQITAIAVDANQRELETVEIKIKSDPRSMKRA